MNSETPVFVWRWWKYSYPLISSFNICFMKSKSLAVFFAQRSIHYQAISALFWPRLLIKFFFFSFGNPAMIHPFLCRPFFFDQVCIYRHFFNVHTDFFCISVFYSFKGRNNWNKLAGIAGENPRLQQILPSFTHVYSSLFASVGGKKKAQTFTPLWILLQLIENSWSTPI